MNRISILIIFFFSFIGEVFPQSEYEYVDLGLSVKWATKNIGASEITDYGDFYAWGEINPKNEYDWTTYKYTEEGATRMTKYSFSSLGAIKDYIDTLEPSDDAATYNWGQQWRTPTLEEMNELLQNCTWIWTNNYQSSGIAGYIVRSKIDGFTNKSIFLPAAGHWGGKSPYDTNKMGMYWTASLDFESLASLKAAQLYFGKTEYRTISYDRQIGMTVRPVLNEGGNNRPKDYSVSGKIQGFDFVDLGLSVLWATANVGALTPKRGGDLFSWGETSTKEVYSEKTYLLSSDGTYNHVSKYNKRDSLTTLEPCDDAATQNWGTSWRTPTIDEINELIQNCEWKIKLGGLYGKSKINGNVIIISISTGCKEDDWYRAQNSGGYYWSANNWEVDRFRGWAWVISSYMYTTPNINRYWGMAIRPVASKDSPDIITNIVNVDSNKTQSPQKKLFLKNGKVVLMNNGNFYNINGTRIYKE